MVLLIYHNLLFKLVPEYSYVFDVVVISLQSNIHCRAYTFLDASDCSRAGICSQYAA